MGRRYHSYKKWKSNHKHNTHYPYQKSHNNNKNYTTHNHKKYNSHKSRHYKKSIFSRTWIKALLWLSISIITAMVTIKFNYEFLNYINAFVWIIFSFYLYAGAFRFINSLNMANDLSLWLLRIISSIVSLLSFYFGIIILLSLYLTRGNPFFVGFGIITLGLGLLAAFMTFRTERGYSKTFFIR